MAAPRIFLKVFLMKHKLNNLIKREIHILTTTTIKKTRKYKKFTIAFYEFSIRLEDKDESCTGDESWVCGFLIKYLSIILAKE